MVRLPLALLIAGQLCLTGCLSGGSSESCAEEPPGAQIDAYLEREGLTDEETTTASGLVYIIAEPGDGARPTLDDRIVINYVGYTPDGSVFDQSGAEPRDFPLAGLIVAWQEAIPLIGKGGAIKILAPPSLAYGPSPPPGIQCGAVLIFDVELVDVPTQSR